MSSPHEHGSQQQRVSIPDELKQFLEVVNQFIRGIEDGRYRLDEEHTHLVDGDYLTWSFHSGISGKGIWGTPNEGLTEFEFQCGPPVCGGDWHFDVSRAEIARIASGVTRDLLLYSCAHPLCGYRSSERFVRCPGCDLQAGVDIADADTTVRGLCPYCRKLLRSLSARQCPHCLMDWHDPQHPTRLGNRS